MSESQTLLVPDGDRDGGRRAGGRGLRRSVIAAAACTVLLTLGVLAGRMHGSSAVAARSPALDAGAAIPLAGGKGGKNNDDDDDGGGKSKSSSDDDDDGGGKSKSSSDDDDDGGKGSGGKGGDDDDNDGGKSSNTPAPTQAPPAPVTAAPTKAAPAPAPLTPAPSPAVATAAVSPTARPTYGTPTARPTDYVSPAPYPSPTAVPSAAPTPAPVRSPRPTLSPTTLRPTMSHAPSFSGGVGGMDDNGSPSGFDDTVTTVDDDTLVVTTPDDDGIAVDDDADDGTPKPTMSPAPTYTLAPTGLAVSIFKRTHASADAEADAAFVSHFFGMNVTTNETFTHPAVPGSDTTGAPCAKRMSLSAMPAFEVHYFESLVTPDGPVPVADWVAYWRKLADGFEKERWDAWDAFMWNAQVSSTAGPPPDRRHHRRGVV